MSEFSSRRHYSPAAQRVTEAFSKNPEMLEQYKQRGLIATNNLGLRMFVFEAGPDSELWQFYASSLFTSGIPERLERARTADPELWRTSVLAYKTRGELITAFASAHQSYGSEDARTASLLEQSEVAGWHDVELRTRVFDIIDTEPLSEDEAMALCL